MGAKLDNGKEWAIFCLSLDYFMCCLLLERCGLALVRSLTFWLSLFPSMSWRRQRTCNVCHAVFSILRICNADDCISLHILERFYHLILAVPPGLPRLVAPAAFQRLTNLPGR